MNAQQLIAELQQIDGDTPIVFPDSENGYRNVGVVAVTRMSIHDDPTFTYEKLGRFVNQDRLPTRLVAILEEYRSA